MKRLSVVLSILASFLPVATTSAVAQQSCGSSDGYFNDNGVWVEAGTQTCAPVGGSQDALYRYERSVRSEPSLCVGTPDALQETITWYLLGSNDRAGSLTRCVGPDIPRAPLPSAPSALDVFRSASLPMPEVHVSPRVRGLVGMETYLWWGADTAVPPLSVTAGEWSASIEVQATRITWDLGNGDVVTSESAGTSQQPALTYVYTRQCDCAVTLTVEWSGIVTLTHPLAPAPIVQSVGPVAFTDTFPYVVDEREAVIVG